MKSKGEASERETCREAELFPRSCSFRTCLGASCHSGTSAFIFS